MVGHLPLLRRLANNRERGGNNTTYNGPPFGLRLIRARHGKKCGPLFLLRIRPLWNAIVFLNSAKDKRGVIGRFLTLQYGVLRRRHRRRRPFVPTLWVLRRVFHFFPVNNGIHECSIRIMPDPSHFFLFLGNRFLWIQRLTLSVFGHLNLISKLSVRISHRNVIRVRGLYRRPIYRLQNWGLWRERYPKVINRPRNLSVPKGQRTKKHSGVFNKGPNL